MRTTINIDDPILKELKRLQETEGKPLGRLISDLLALALRARQRDQKPRRGFKWLSRKMGARVDLRDREAILDAMDDPTEGS